MTRIKLLLLLLFFGIQLQASEKQFHFKHITSKEGLNQSHILCMTQDSEGFMWIGTYGGLNRYNGYNMDYFMYDSQDSTSLSHNIVHCVFEDFDKNIWVGTENGLNRFNKKNDSFERFTNNTKKPNELIPTNIRAICQQDSSSIWIGTYGHGLYKFNINTRKFTHFKHDESSPSSLISDLINVLYIDRDNNLWIGTENGGLSEYNAQSKSFTNYVPDQLNPNSLNNDIVSSIVQDKNGIFWIGTWHGGLNRFDPQRKTFTNYPDNRKKQTFYPFSTVRDLLIDSDDNIWIATLGGGLAILDKDRKSFSYQKHNEEDPLSLQIDMLWSLTQDREGQIWCGTFGSGISIYNPSRQKFDLYPKRKDKSFSSEIIQDIYEKDDSTLWLATFNGINVFDRTTKECKSHLLLDLEPNSKDIKKIFKDNLGHYWLGTSAGLLLVNKDLKTCQKVVMGSPIYDIYQDKSGDLWAGGWNSGLIFISKNELLKKDMESLHYHVYKHDEKDPNSITSNTIWNIYQDHKDKLWIVNYTSTQIFDRDSKRFLSVPIPNLESGFQVVEDHNGDVWIPTTTKGVLQFKSSTGESIYYSRNNYLPNNTALSVVEDNNGMIWTATNDGLSCIHPKTKQVINYTTYDGLPDSKFIVGAITKLKNGNIAMGSNLGFILFNPSLIFKDTMEHNTAITDIKLFGKSISKGRNKSANKNFIKKSANNLDTLLLSYHQNMLTIEFSALSFSRPEENRYKYKMEGFDENWIESNHERKATYTNLDPNEYIFRIKSSNNNGIWSQKEKKLIIIISPPWWQTNWFRFVALLLIVVISGSFYYYKTGEIKRQKAELELLVNQRTQELQLANHILVERQEQILEKNKALIISENKQKELNATKDKFFGIISHDLRSPFNSIIGLSRELNENFNEFDTDTQREFIKDIYEGSQNTFELLENLLIWANSQSGKIEFSPQRIDIAEVTSKIIGLLNQAASNKSIQLTNQISRKVFVMADKNMLSTIIRNILSNSIKFTPKNGSIQIKATPNHQEIEICITDNGVGMSKEVQEQIFDISTNHSSLGTENEKGTGLGLLLCKEFTEKQGGKIWVESKPGEGTSFYFTIPNA